MKHTNSVSIIKGAESYSNYFNPQKGVLFLHGFLGNPSEMRYLAEKIEQAGFSVNIPRLPGHGTSVDDMIASDAESWLTSAREAFLEISARCEKVYIAGLSMGGCMTALLAAEFDAERIAIISMPASIIGEWKMFALPLITKFIQTVPNEGKRGLNWDEQREIHITYDSLPLAKTRDLQKIIHRAMKALSGVTCPALVIQSKGDEVIPQNSADRIFKSLASAEKAKRIYQDSNHLIIKDHDRDAVASDIISFFTC